MLKLLKNHILTLHEKIGLLVLYGGIMFCLGMAANYLFTPSTDTTVQDIALPYGLPDMADEDAEALQDVLEQTEEPESEDEAEEEQHAEDITEDIAEDTAEDAPVIAENDDNGLGYSEYVTDMKVKKGDTVMDMLIKAGVAREEAYQAATTLGKSYNLRQLQIGQKLQAVFREGAVASGIEAGELQFMLLRIEEPERTIALEKNTDGAFVVNEHIKQLERVRMHAEGVISSSLYVLASSLGVPPGVLQDAIDAYSFDVDFQREIQPGSRFGILYETFFDKAGEKVRDGDLLYATLTVRGQALEIVRFSPSGAPDDADYYTIDGHILRKTLMKTPISGAAISSSFGVRKHPISGYTKMHKGVDFAAARGTPVYAAGDGSIQRIGRNGGYGNYIRIRHTSEYDTAYAHLNRFAKGMKQGRRVKQGQVIGYVGSTGRSTGPHLHFEVLKQGKQINPMKLNLKPTQKLQGASLNAFQTHVKLVRRWLKDKANAQLVHGKG